MNSFFRAFIYWAKYQLATFCQLGIWSRLHPHFSHSVLISAGIFANH